jgi:hypothetical protein
MKPDKYLINITGETRICYELLKRRHHAVITMGNAKATDIIILGKNHRFLRVEVKTSNNGRNFVTGYYPKYTKRSTIHPDIWIFYLLENKKKSLGERFFIGNHKKVGKIQLKVNGGKKTKKGEGCDNIPLRFLENKGLENNWKLVKETFGRINK